MRSFILFILVTCIGCSSQPKLKLKDSVSVVLESCPEDGDCGLELLKNKRLVIKKDSLGDLYYEIEDSKDTDVVRYNYHRRNENQYADGTYREELTFEIKSEDLNLNLTGKHLQETKMVFGRFCYCKGETGYYKVEKGTLVLKRQNKKGNLHIEFKIAQVPQVVSKIQAVLK